MSVTQTKALQHKRRTTGLLPMAATVVHATIENKSKGDKVTKSVYCCLQYANHWWIDGFEVLKMVLRLGIEKPLAFA